MPLEPPHYKISRTSQKNSMKLRFVSLAKDTKFIDYQNAQIILVGARDGRDVIRARSVER
jgi:hypothetical protein